VDSGWWDRRHFLPWSRLLKTHALLFLLQARFSLGCRQRGKPHPFQYFRSCRASLATAHTTPPVFPALTCSEIRFRDRFGLVGRPGSRGRANMAGCVENLWTARSFWLLLLVLPLCDLVSLVGAEPGPVHLDRRIHHDNHSPRRV